MKVASASAARSSCRRSFHGAQMSSSSMNATQSARAAAMPAFLAPARPFDFSWRTTRTRSSSIEASRAAVSSSDPSSTTMTSRSTPSCASTEGSAPVDKRCHRSRVGMTTLTSGTAGIAERTRAGGRLGALRSRSYPFRSLAVTQDSARARVGVVGCGATAQLNHLPALSRLGLRPEVVVDAEPSRAQEVGERFGAARHTSDLAEAAELIDRAVVATPPGSHAPIAETLLAQGVHVLLEKPMATSGEEGRRIAAAAEASGGVVCVGLTRRHWHATRWLAAFLDAGARAEVEFFDWREGFGFGWPAETDHFIRNEDGGGGALLDMGSHTIGLMLMR